MPDPIRVVVADDHYLVREGIRRVLSSAGIEVVAAVGTAEELEAAVDAHEPDAVVTDIRMPPEHRMEGIEAAHRIRVKHGTVGVVVVSQYNDATYAMELLRDGTEGFAYLLKERIGDPEALVGAVREVARGGSRIDPDVVGALVRRPQRRSALDALTPRELEVLEQMAEGCTNRGIAERMCLSESSVEKYATSLFSKLGLSEQPDVHRRVAAVLAFLHDQGRAGPLTGGDGAR